MLSCINVLFFPIGSVVQGTRIPYNLQRFMTPSVTNKPVNHASMENFLTHSLLSTARRNPTGMSRAMTGEDVALGSLDMAQSNAAKSGSYTDSCAVSPATSSVSPATSSVSSATSAEFSASLTVSSAGSQDCHSLVVGDVVSTHKQMPKQTVIPNTQTITSSSLTMTPSSLPQAGTIPATATGIKDDEAGHNSKSSVLDENLNNNPENSGSKLLETNASVDMSADVDNEDKFLDWILHSPSADVPDASLPEVLNTAQDCNMFASNIEQDHSMCATANLSSPSKDITVLNKDSNDQGDTMEISPSIQGQMAQDSESSAKPDTDNAVEDLEPEATPMVTRVANMKNGLWKKVSFGRLC